MSKIFYKNNELEFDKIKNSTSLGNDNFIASVCKIIADWNSGRKKFKLKTSGSTAKAKIIFFTKEQLIISAKQTIETFKISKSDTLFLCLPVDHSAGFMMVIRALVCKANLLVLKPSKNPLKEISLNQKIDFFAFIPQQFSSLILETPEKIKILNKSRAVIIGGERISKEIIAQAKEIQAPVFHTYGMTETLTHVALKRLNGKNPDKYFHLLKNIKAETDNKNRLILQTPLYPSKKLYTNDIVNLNKDQSFEWLTRADNIINSSGFKINPDELAIKIENQISEIFKNTTYFFFSIPDKIVGEKLMLAIESSNSEKKEMILKLLTKKLKRYEIPKEIIFIDNFVYSSLGKINKIKTIEEAKIK
ncbi:MAG: AMP-binding protein [Bacteroidota bacterium]|nr:AMP-binding protein [Bacteroidota bacterium]